MELEARWWCCFFLLIISSFCCSPCAASPSCCLADLAASARVSRQGCLGRVHTARLVGHPELRLLRLLLYDHMAGRHGVLASVVLVSTLTVSAEAESKATHGVTLMVERQLPCKSRPFPMHCILACSAVGMFW